VSQKAVAQKLLIKENYRILLLNEPEGYRSMLGELPPNTRVSTEASSGPFDLIQVFAASRKELEDFLPKVKALLNKKGLLWVTYPKGMLKVKTDINRDSIREFAAGISLQAVAMVSIDETWSAMRLKLV
jgi:hypothetical protein